MIVGASNVMYMVEKTPRAQVIYNTERRRNITNTTHEHNHAHSHAYNEYNVVTFRAAE